VKSKTEVIGWCGYRVIEMDGSVRHGLRRITVTGKPASTA
jgi:hypothetical protein